MTGWSIRWATDVQRARTLQHGRDEPGHSCSARRLGRRTRASTLGIANCRFMTQHRLTAIAARGINDGRTVSTGYFVLALPRPAVSDGRVVAAACSRSHLGLRLQPPARLLTTPQLKAISIEGSTTTLRHMFWPLERLACTLARAPPPAVARRLPRTVVVGHYNTSSRRGGAAACILASGRGRRHHRRQRLLRDLARQVPYRWIMQPLRRRISAAVHTHTRLRRGRRRGLDGWRCCQTTASCIEPTVFLEREQDAMMNQRETFQVPHGFIRPFREQAPAEPSMGVLHVTEAGTPRHGGVRATKPSPRSTGQGPTRPVGSWSGWAEARNQCTTPMKGLQSWRQNPRLRGPALFFLARACEIIPVHSMTGMTFQCF